MSPLRKLLLLLSLIVILFVVGTVGYMVVEGASFLDGLYMTVITLASVGYREVVPLSAQGKIFTIGLITLGVGTVSFTIFTIGGIVVEGQVRKILGRRHLERQIKALNNHYIVCGFGRMGRVLVQQLAREEVPFVVIENNEEKLKLVAATDHLHVVGDATTEDVLEAANIRKARGLVTTVASDADNLFITLSARGLNPEMFIMARAFDERSEGKLLRAGANRVVDPYRIGGMRLAHAILRPAVVEFMEFATHRAHLELEMEELRVMEGSQLSGVSLKDSQIRTRFGLMIIAVKRIDGSMLFNPPSDTVMDEGDVLIAIGKPDDLKELEIVLSAPAAAEA
jgi:voltage-gated potassium channel